MESYREYLRKNSENTIISEKHVHSNMNLKSNAMSSSPQVMAKQTGTVKNSAAQGMLRYININKRKMSPQKAYNTEKNQKITRLIP